MDAKYQRSDLYTYGVRSKYIIGFKAEESILFFKTEYEAKSFINQNPDKREYLGQNPEIAEAQN